MTLKLSSKLYLSFGGVSLIAAALAGIGISSLMSIDEKTQEIVKHNMPTIEALNDINEGCLGVTMTQRSLLVPQIASSANLRKAQYDFAEAKRKILAEGLQHFEASNVVSSPAEAALVKEFSDNIHTWMKLSDELFVLAHKRDDFLDRKLESESQETAKIEETLFNDAMEARTSWLKANDAIVKLLKMNSDDSERSASDAATSVKTSRTLLSLCALAGISLAGILAVLLVRGMTKPINRVVEELSEGAEQIRSASQQLAAASQDLSEAASEQAGAIEETSASLQEMSAMMEANVENAGNSSANLDGVNQISQEGNNTMSELLESMKSILESNEKIIQLVNVISAIGEQTEVIDEIVFQTKLLSFNASVEAERAGEHGRGFAVVAQEVGNLAEMSSKAAGQISSIVKESIKNAEAITGENKRKVEAGYQLVMTVAQALKAVGQRASQVSDLARQNVQSSREQLHGVSQITTAMTQLDKATQQNASISEEAAASSEQLSAQAEVIASFVHELNRLINGDDAEIGIRTSAVRAGSANPRKVSAPARPVASPHVGTLRGRGAEPKPQARKLSRSASPARGQDSGYEPPLKAAAEDPDGADSQWERI